jgi:enoyl-[acyl-carrier-protein] reductase (NADH)
MAAGGLDNSNVDMDQLGKQSGAMHPLGRAITAEDCAEAAVYLASDRAINVTGVLLPLDGGYVAQ